MALPADSELTRPSGIVLLAVNSLPLFGVLLFGWSVFDVVFFYWIENVIIGALNVARILTSSGELAARDDPRLQGQKSPKKPGGAKIFLAVFFTVHYGLFCWGHQQFVIGMFGDERSVAEVMADPVIGIGILAIAGSHLFSFFKNYIDGGENQRVSAATLMTRPYGRIIVLHVTIIIGGFLVMLAGSQVLLLVALIAVKTIVDFRQHGRERGLLAAT